MNYSRNISAEYIRKALTSKCENNTDIPVEASLCGNYCVERVPTSEMAEEIILKNESGAIKRKLIHFCFSHKESIKRIPVIGTKLVEIKKRKLEAGRKMIDISEYLPLHYSEFIPLMYKLLLNRLPDDSGLASFVAMVKNGASNAALAYIFAVSDEFTGRAAVANLKQYKKQYKKYLRSIKIKRLPIIGRLARLAALPSQLSTFYDNYEYYNGKLMNTTAALHEKYMEICGNIDEMNRKLDSAAAFTSENYSSLCGEINKLNAFTSEKYSSLCGEINKLNAFTSEKYNSLCGENQGLAGLVRENSNMIVNLHEKNDNMAQIMTAVSQKQDNLPEYISQVAQKTKTVVSGIPGGVISVMAGDFIFGVPSGEWGLAHFLSLNDHFEKGTEEAFCRLLKPGMNVLDIGANLGMFTLHALKAGCNVYSFEPSPDIFRIMNQNIKVNGFAESGSAHTFQTAVSDEEKTISFFICEGMSGHSNMYAAEKSGDVEIQVQTTVIDEMAVLPDKVDVIKIDVEGAEYKALCGMKKLISRNPQIKILMEFAPEIIKRADVEPSDLLELIKKFGFELYLIDEATGDVSPVGYNELMQCFSVNLLLSKEKIDL